MSESMTGIIYYCDACTHRIPDADQKDGSAGQGPNGKMLCAKCSDKSLPASSPRRRATPISPAPSPVQQPPAAAHPTPIRMAKPQPKPMPPPRKKFPVELLAGGIVAMGIITLLVGLMLRNSNNDAVVASSAKKEVSPKPAESSVAKPSLISPPAPTPAAPVASTPKPVTAAPVQPTAQTAATALATPESAPNPPAKAPAPAADFDPRADYANHLLDQAKEFIAKNPEEVFTYKEMLEKLRDNYRSLAPGKEAAQLLSELKLPATDPALDPPLPPDDAWAKATQIIPTADPAKDVHAGNWSKSDAGLRSDKGGNWAKYSLPYLLPDEYDIRVTFTRAENEDCLLVNLAHHGRAIVFSIGGAGNTGCSLEDITPKKKYVLPVKLTRNGVLSSGQRTTVIVQVREKIARAFLNGKPIVGCVMDDAAINNHPDISPANPRQLGLLTWLSAYEVHSMEVIEIKGKGEFTR